MSDALLDAIRYLIQEDVGGRGLRTDPQENLLTVCAGDFQAACHSLAEVPDPALAIFTGFYIGDSPYGFAETDGPLGALFLARALTPLGFKVALWTDSFCKPALLAGLAACNLRGRVVLYALPPPRSDWGTFVKQFCEQPDWHHTFFEGDARLTHLIALERAGPSHTPHSVRAQPRATAATVEQFTREVPPADHDRCHSMRGRDITVYTAPAHLLFEAASSSPTRVVTIGIGDGGNEIGMGKIPWAVLRRNIPGGGRVACRVPTDHLIVCGVSNWGAYGLAAGVSLLRGRKLDPALLDPERERDLLRVLVEKGRLVDGVTGQAAATVDGLSFERYAEVLRSLRELAL